jgi:hypothetical protein
LHNSLSFSIEKRRNIINPAPKIKFTQKLYPLHIYYYSESSWTLAVALIENYSRGTARQYDELMLNMKLMLKLK